VESNPSPNTVKDRYRRAAKHSGGKSTSKVQSFLKNTKPLVLTRGSLLRETHENSNYILLRIPIEISNSGHGEKAIAVAEAPLSSILPLSPDSITRLQDVRLIRLPRSVKVKKPATDYVELQQVYRRILAEGPYANQADLARHIGVSRVWVSRVLKGIKRKAKSIDST
jgi:hypothetical protein